MKKRRKVMQAFVLICSEWSDSHFLTVYDNTHINLYYAKVFCIYMKDSLEKNGLQNERGITGIQ